MKKKKEKQPDDTQLSEDIDVFEEYEETGKTAKVASPDESDDLPPPREEDPPPVPKHGKDASEPAPTVAGTLANELAELTPDIPVNLVAVIGKKTISISQLINCRIGHVLDLGRPPGETVDLVANGRLIAKGELVEMDGKMGVRILKLVR